MMKTRSSIELVIILHCFGCIVVSDAVAEVDLRLGYVAVTRRAVDSLYYRGDPVSMAYQVRNIGDETSSDFTVDFYVGDYPIGSVEGPYPLSPNSSAIRSGTFPVPDTMPHGDHRIWGRVTCENDSNLENNTATDMSPISIKESQVTHLIVNSVSAPSIVYRPGDSVEVTAEIEAVGGQLSADYEINYYASSAGSPAITYHIGENSGSLAPAEEDSLPTACRFPEDMPEGNCHIEGVVTWQGIDGMKSYRAMSDSVWIGERPEADLEVISVEPVEGTYGPGEEISVYSLVENIGNEASGPYTIDFYASLDNTITTNDYHLAYVDRSSLEPGAQHSTNTSCHFPANIREGTYYVGAIVQPSQLESDITNNKACSNVTVEVVPSARYVSGRMQYKNYKRYPIRYARVKIYEDDHNTNPLDDHVIMETYTDHAGYFGILLPEAANDGQAIFVRVFAEGAEEAYPEAVDVVGT